MKKLLYITTLCLCSFFVLHSVNAETLKLTKRVTDNANVIPDDVEAALEAKLADFEAKTTNQFVIVTLPNLPEGETVETAAYNIFNENAIGQKDKNNGLLFLLSTGERQTRFEVGYGLEPIFPDILAGRILREDMAPLFKEGDFGGGITTGVDKVIEIITKGEVYEEPAPAVSTDPDGAEGLFFVFFLILGFGRVILSYMAKSKSVLAGGVIGLILGIIGFILTGIVWMFGFIILGLLFDWFISGNSRMGQALRSLKPRKGIGRGGFWSSGGWSGASGGGGFSGGGGSSGGGGASGGY